MRVQNESGGGVSVNLGIAIRDYDWNKSELTLPCV